MSEQVKDTLKGSAPWREGVAWWVVLVEGVIALGLGIYILLQPAEATLLLGKLISIYLIVAGLVQTIGGFRSRGRSGVGNVAFIRGVVGLIFGGLVLLLLMLDLLSFDLGAIMLAIGMGLYGLLGLYVGFFDRKKGHTRWGVVINSALFIGIALLLFLAVTRDTPVMQLLSLLFIIFGGALILYGITLRRQEGAEAESSPDVAEAAAADKADSGTDQTPPPVDESNESA